jgi:hypothetical protein
MGSYVFDGEDFPKDTSEAQLEQAKSKANK